VWAHVSGSDLVRDAAGTVYVLEDNLRVPSGVSYLLENRLVSKRAFADLFAHQSIQPVDDYPYQLLRLLTSLARDGVTYPTVAVLTPGIYNSAYFEHSFLAQRMGVALVEGRDLFVGSDDRVYMRTVAGPQPVHVIYRRIDDLFLDPDELDPGSVLGVRGLMRAWRAGHVAIANAPGAGVADDKVVYAWVPDLIRYYLGEDPIIPNVPTYRCLYETERRHVLDNLRSLVVKPADESGGYGLVIGDRATDGDLAPRGPGHRGRSPAVGGPADPGPVDGPHAVRRHDPGPARGPAALRPHRPHQLRDPGRPDAGGAARGVARGQLLAGGRVQGHLGGRDVRRNGG
jgi:uncharacterized circularly permuted ATP-grasp superfamily protein